MAGSIWVVIPGFLIWLGVLCLPSQPWRIRETFLAKRKTGSLSEITVLIPARNEERYIKKTVEALLTQEKNLQITIIDDQSTDNTISVAKSVVATGLTIIQGEPLPEGWSGKLWALEQGRRTVLTPLILLLDADITLAPGTMISLLEKKKQEQLQMISLMAELKMKMFWECLLLPAFIYFFRLLYPFHASNQQHSKTAAAAGGCILVDTAMLEKIGGFSTLKKALIDDCQLAKHIKQYGGKTWLGLTHCATSARDYEQLSDVWQMVARTAFSQLHYSLTALLVCTLLMTSAFIMPIFGLFLPDNSTNLLSIITIFLMLLGYQPTLQYYNLSPTWGLLFFIAGGLFMLMTWSSAKDYFFKGGAKWKGRNYLW